MSQYDDDFDRWCQYGDQEDAEGPNMANCQRCGARVEFIHSGVRWRMYEAGAVTLHACAKVASVDDFDDVSGANHA